jgi:hypothetical protein
MPYPVKTTSYVSPIGLREDLPRENASEYWAGPHAEIVRRLPGVIEYVQHHFSTTDHGFWPSSERVGTREPWCDAARELADAHGLPLEALRIGHLDGDLFAPRCTWLRRREFGPAGAVLVRPDRFLAWRSLGEASDPVAALEDALAQAMARQIRVPARV